MRKSGLQAQQYRAFMRAAVAALHDAPIDSLRLVAAVVSTNVGGNRPDYFKSPSLIAPSLRVQVKAWKLLRAQLPKESIVTVELPAAVFELQASMLPFKEHSDSKLNHPKFHRAVSQTLI